MLTTVKKIGPTLDLFSRNHPEWGVTEVSSALGMSKSSAHALLTTMDEIGLLERTRDARYRLGWRLLSLSRTLLQTTEYRDHVSRALHAAVEESGETMHLAVFDHGSVVYLECVRSAHSVQLPTHTGARLPAHPSAVGKVLLAHRDDDAAARYTRSGALRRYTANTIVSPAGLFAELDRARDDGVAYDREETIRGLCCIGAPVRDREGAVLAAVSICATTASMERQADAYRQLVLDVASEASLP
jgi:IclR family KDG regulon transcriptional repressor